MQLKHTYIADGLTSGGGGWVHIAGAYIQNNIFVGKWTAYISGVLKLGSLMWDFKVC